MNKKLAAVGLAAGLGIGGLTGAILGTPTVSGAQTTPTPTAPTASAAPAVGTQAARSKPYADAIAALVKDGTITQAQADKVVAALEAARPADGGRGGKGGDGAGRGAGLTAVSTALGMTPAELKTALQGGQTIAQVAASKNVDVQKVIDAMVAEYKTKETAEIATGDHTQAEVDQKVADFTTRATDIVNGRVPVGGPQGGKGGRGGRGQNGTAPAVPATAAPAAAVAA
jgi:hypothetical protein